MTTTEPEQTMTSEPILFAQPRITEADVDAVTAVLRSGWITTGAECAHLEAELAEYLGASEVVAVSSCTAALEISLAHLRLRPGARVGVPAWTFASSALSVVRNGYVPVLLDVDADTLNVAPASLAAALDEGLEAAVVVHFGGVAVAPEIHALCAGAHIPVVEDAAHALGASDGRGRIGGSGTSAACFSFYATKNITAGEGGALATDDPDLAAFARTYRSHGMDADAWDRYRPQGQSFYDITEPGIKANLPDLLATLARSQLRRFDAMQAQRHALVRQYREHLAPTAVEFVPRQPAAGSADHLMAVLLPNGVDRNRVVTGLKRENIHPSVHFRPLHRFTWFAANAPIGPSGLTVCDELESRALSLPLHVGLTDADVERVCSVLSDLLSP